MRYLVPLVGLGETRLLSKSIGGLDVSYVGIRFQMTDVIGYSMDQCGSGVHIRVGMAAECISRVLGCLGLRWVDSSMVVRSSMA